MGVESFRNILTEFQETQGMYRSTARFRFGATLGVMLIAAGFTGADTQVRWGTAILRQKPEWYASARGD